MRLGVFAIVGLVVRRVAARWRLLLPLLAGAVLAVALLASTSLYGDAVRRLGLRHALDQVPPQTLDIALKVDVAPTDRDKYRAVRNEVDSSIYRRVLWYIENCSPNDTCGRALQGETFYVNQVGTAGQALDPSPANLRGTPEVVRDPRRRAFFYHDTDFLDGVHFVAGEKPAVVTVQRDADGKPIGNPELPAVIFEESAAKHGLSVGDHLLLVPFRDEATKYADIRVVGVVQRKDPQARQWKSSLHDYAVRTQPDNFIALFVPEETYFEGVGHLFPKMLSTYHWNLLVEGARIDVANVALAKFGADDLQRQLRTTLSNFSQRSDLVTVLSDFETKQLFGRVPLLIVVLMILGIVSYYLVMVANVVVERQLGEVALLRSRGAGGEQIFLLYLCEALAIGAIAFFVGPLLALIGTKLLGFTPAFADLTNGAVLPVKLTSTDYAYALGGAVLAVLAMALPTLRAARLNPLRVRLGLGRPTDASFLTRYYLDVFIAVIAGILYWELTQRGSAVSGNVFGAGQVDEALLAAPALFLLAIALLLLRLFPLLLRLLGWLAARGRAWLVLALWQMGRNPIPYTRPILLLMLASAVAMFAANFGATLERSYRERALYASGGDLVLQGLFLTSGGASVPFSNVVRNISGEKSPTYRGDAYRTGQLTGSTNFDLLAVDPETFGWVAWYREDFSTRSLDSLLSILRQDGPQTLGIELPRAAQSLRVWVRPATPRRDVQVNARLVDSNGRYSEVMLGTLATAEWQAFEVPVQTLRLSASRTFLPVAPLRLIALTVRQTSGDALVPGAVYFDTVETLSGSTWNVVASLGEGVQANVVREERGASGDTFESSSSAVRQSDRPVAVFIWGQGSLASTRGAFFGPPPPGPLQVIASETVLTNHQLRVGDDLALNVDGHLVPARIAGTVSYFPTMDPFEHGFLIANMHTLLQRVNAVETVIDQQPNEYWIATGLEGQARAAYVKDLGATARAQVLDRERFGQSFRQDPLIAAGWRGILAMAFLAVVAATLLGFGVYSFVQAQQRRLEFAILRSMGMSPLGLAGTVLIEQAVVVLVGMGLGAWMGYELTSILLPFLDLTERGSQVLPSFAAQVNWPAVLLTYGIMALVFLAATAGMVTFFARLGINRALRFGDV